MCPFSAIKEAGAIAYVDDGVYTIESPTPFNMEQESLSLTCIRRFRNLALIRFRIGRFLS